MEKHKIIPLEELKKLNSPINANEKHKENLTLLDKIAIFITKVVGTMWCAIAFTLIALIGLPDAISGGKYEFINWLTQTLLQLVLFSVVIVGQNLQSRHSQRRAEIEYNTSIKSEAEIESILAHLENQNEILKEIQSKLENK